MSRNHRMNDLYQTNLITWCGNNGLPVPRFKRRKESSETCTASSLEERTYSQIIFDFDNFSKEQAAALMLQIFQKSLSVTATSSSRKNSGDTDCSITENCQDSTLQSYHNDTSYLTQNDSIAANHHNDARASSLCDLAPIDTTKKSTDDYLQDKLNNLRADSNFDTEFLDYNKDPKTGKPKQPKIKNEFKTKRELEQDILDQYNSSADFSISERLPPRLPMPATIDENDHISWINLYCQKNGIDSPKYSTPTRALDESTTGNYPFFIQGEFIFENFDVTKVGGGNSKKEAKNEAARQIREAIFNNLRKNDDWQRCFGETMECKLGYVPPNKSDNLTSSFNANSCSGTFDMISTIKSEIDETEGSLSSLMQSKCKIKSNPKINCNQNPVSILMERFQKVQLKYDDAVLKFENAVEILNPVGSKTVKNFKMSLQFRFEKKAKLEMVHGDEKSSKKEAKRDVAKKLLELLDG